MPDLPAKPDAAAARPNPSGAGSAASADAHPGGRVFFRLLGLLRPFWGRIALGVFLLILASPCELFPGLVWKYVTDDLILRDYQNTERTFLLADWFSFGGRLNTWQALLVSSLSWLLVIYVMGELFQSLSFNLMNRIAQKFILGLRNRVYHKLQGQSLSYLQRQRTGDLMSRAMADVDEIQGFIVNGIDVILGEALLWVLTVAIVLWMDWKVTVASLAPLLLVYVLLRTFNRRIAPIYKAVRDKTGELSTRLQENLSGVVVIKIFGREKEEAQRFRKATEDYYDEQIRSINHRTVYFPTARIVGFFSNINMLAVGAWSILTGGGMTVGKLLMFRAYWWRLFGPVQTLARVNDMVQRAMAAGRRVFEVLDAPDEMPDAPDAKPIDHVRGGMELRDVTFHYPGEIDAAEPPPDVLRDVTIRIEPGQTVALAGPSGSGKSTVLNLLLRFYDPTSGRVLLDGRELPSITRTSLRRQFALVQQETFLFNDSIIDNIRYGHAEATMEQVIAAAKAANAHDFITKLPNGYDTKVGERGVRLSGGQKQRISIARAFLANPTILLLDEPTSSVEPDSEAAIIAALDRLMAGRTTVLTSHRPSLINQADVVYVIEEGRVTEQGPPEDLARNDGWFARFMRSAEFVGRREVTPVQQLEAE